MLKTVLAVVALCATMIFGAFTANAAGGSPSTNARIRLEARLSGTSTAMKGQARYQDERGVRRFDASVERAQPNTTYQVSHKSVVIATITTNSLGRGEVSVRTRTDNPGQQGPVPVMATGDVITITGGNATISGSLRVK
jgi:hypothetical protein